jgi:hypothetical protein
MTTRTVSHDRGDHIEVVVYQDGVEISRTSKAKKRQPEPEPPAGDALEELLTSYGITKERWMEIKKKFGLPPTCNCEARSKWISEVASAHPVISGIGTKLLSAFTRR